MIKQLQKADQTLTFKGGEALIQKWAAESKVDPKNDAQMVSWLEAQNVEARVAALRASFLKSQIQDLFKQLPATEQGSLLSSLKA
mmetsp:Transcript_27530/g.51621  ORF Transcript_27530/g.51621 Transcript_27530/m.51621 type:complete len:85 (-) Transcript_27530:343-597(-)